MDLYTFAEIIVNLCTLAQNGALLSNVTCKFQEHVQQNMPQFVSHLLNAEGLYLGSFSNSTWISLVLIVVGLYNMYTLVVSL